MTELDPNKFDAQTAEIFLTRLNKALGIPERTTLTDALIAITTLRGERDHERQARKDAWLYFHQRIAGLACGVNGTWEQALNELTAYIRNLLAQIKTLEQQAVPTVALPALAPPRTGTLEKTDRALLIEEIPHLIVRIERLEKVAFPSISEPS